MAGGKDARDKIKNMFAKLLGPSVRCLYSKDGTGKATKHGYTKRAVPESVFKLLRGEFHSIVESGMVLI